MSEDGPNADASEAPAGPRKAGLAQRVLPWVITILCFAYLYQRLAGAAARAGNEQGVFGYLAEVFASVSWSAWLGLMVPYSILYFLIDTAVLWRVINWFNARVAYGDLLPVRASTYIISILNEQVGKGAIALYLNRREGVPGWQVGSSMLFIMFCEFYYLLGWALIGCLISWDAVPAIFHAIPIIAAGAFVVLLAIFWLFRGREDDEPGLFGRQIFHSFRRANLGHLLGVIVIRSPALLGAVWVYAKAAGLFGVEIGFVEMLGFLPVIFFGTLVPGPFRAVAVSMWPTLFPDNEFQMTAFGVVQHNFFVLFNAVFGLFFLRRANRELLETPGRQAETTS